MHPSLIEILMIQCFNSPVAPNVKSQTHQIAIAAAV